MRSQRPRGRRHADRRADRGGEIDAVVFLRDPLTAHPHEPDIQALMKVCDVHGVPLATNLASAEILLRSLSGAADRRDDDAPMRT